MRSKIVVYAIFVSAMLVSLGVTNVAGTIHSDFTSGDWFKVRCYVTQDEQGVDDFVDALSNCAGIPSDLARTLLGSFLDGMFGVDGVTIDNIANLRLLITLTVFNSSGWFGDTRVYWTNHTVVSDEYDVGPLDTSTNESFESGLFLMVHQENLTDPNLASMTWQDIAPDYYENEYYSPRPIRLGEQTLFSVPCSASCVNFTIVGYTGLDNVTGIFCFRDFEFSVCSSKLNVGYKLYDSLWGTGNDTYGWTDEYSNQEFPKIHSLIDDVNIPLTAVGAAIFFIALFDWTYKPLKRIPYMAQVPYLDIILVVSGFILLTTGFFIPIF